MLIWDGLAHDKSKKSQHVNPCQSTGIWFTEPTPTTLVFLADLLEWLLVKRTAQWDQAAWNEVTLRLQFLQPAWWYGYAVFDFTHAIASHLCPPFFLDFWFDIA